MGKEGRDHWSGYAGACTCAQAMSDWYHRGNWSLTPGPVCRINHPFFNCPCVMIGQPCTDQCDCGDWCYHPSGSSKVQGVGTADETPTAQEKRIK